jgi:hypothetical protein
LNYAHEYWATDNCLSIFACLLNCEAAARAAARRFKKAFMEEKQTPLSYGHALVVMICDPAFSSIALHSFRRSIEFRSKQVGKGHYA